MACHSSSIGTFITSNKWLRAEYGSKLRNFLLRKTSPKILINLGPGVFDAGVDTNLLLWDNFSSSKSTLYANAFSEGVKNIKFTTQNFTEDSIWVEVSSQEAEIKRKTDLIHSNLSDFNVRLNYGILTGANDAFILDKETAQHLKSLDKKNEKIIKPLLRGQDIERYDAVFNNIYLLNLHNGVKSKNVPPINVHEYPSIKSYLESFGYEFKERGEQGDNWWNLRNCKYILDYAQPKILYSDIVQDRGKFYYDEDGYYTNDTAFMIIGENLKYLLAILNSTLFSYLYRKFYAGGGLGGHGLRFKREFLLKVPIPCADKKTTSDIEEKVNIINMLKKKSHHSDISILENEIDSIVYRIYGMEEDDIKVIEA